MGTQQILLIALGVVLVGIAVVVGINLTQASYSDQIKDLAINQLHEIGSFANTYRARPKDIGGGGGSYKGFKLPSQLSEDALAWTYDFRFGDNRLYIYMISKAKTYEGRPLYLLGLYNGGDLESIRLYDPSERKWEYIYRKTSSEDEDD